MPRPSIIPLLLVLSGSMPTAMGNTELAGVDNEHRARVNYQLACQGCHGPSGEGMTHGDVPSMRGFVGNFLKVAGGRDFLVQVPGSANAALDDAQLAEVLNWILGTMSAQQLPPDFQPYTAGEITSLRSTPIEDLDATRARLVDALPTPTP